MIADLLLQLQASAGLMLRVYAGLLLLFAAATKIGDPLKFEAVLSGYRVVPEPLLPIVARTLPAIEGLIGLLLIAMVGGGYECFAAASLLACFAVAVGMNLARGRTEIDCGCGGIVPTTIHRGIVIGNVLLAALLIAVAGASAPEPLLLKVGAVFGGASLFALHQILGLAMALRRRAIAAG